MRLNLGQYLKDHDITAYRLVREVQGQVAPNTVYSLARKPAQRIDLDTVAKILQALERVRGQKVEITEMLEEQPESADLSHLRLPAGTPAFDPALPKKFRYSGAEGRTKVEGGPSIVDIVSEGRDR